MCWWWRHILLIYKSSACRGGRQSLSWIAVCINLMYVSSCQAYSHQSTSEFCSLRAHGIEQCALRHDSNNSLSLDSLGSRLGLIFSDRWTQSPRAFAAFSVIWASSRKCHDLFFHVLTWKRMLRRTGHCSRRFLDRWTFVKLLFFYLKD